MSRPIRPGTLRNLIAPCILFAATAPSFGTVNGSYIVNADNTVTYSYEVDNSGGTFDIVGWALDFAFAVPDWNQLDAPLGDVTVPNLDWIADAGIPISGLSAQDFLSLGAGDILQGSSLSGFSFTSTFLPGLVTYHEFSALGDSASGEVIGPAVAPVTVPDGGNRVLEAMAVVSLVAIGTGRKLHGRAAAN